MLKQVLTIGLIANALFAFTQRPSLRWAKAIGGETNAYEARIATTELGISYVISGEYNRADDFFIGSYDINGETIWKNIFGGPSYDWGADIAVDKQSNVIATGAFTNKIEFEPGNPALTLFSPDSYRHIFVVKLDNNGAVKWALQFGSGVANAGSGRSVTTDNNGNIYVIGFFYGRIDFNPGPDSAFLTSTNDKSTFLLKLSKDGTYINAIKLNAQSTVDIALDHQSNILLAGNISGIVDMDPGPDSMFLPNSNGHIHITKLDNNGQLIWVKSVGGKFINLPSAIAVDSSNNVLISGTFSDTVDFNPGPGIKKISTKFFMESNAFILKLDSKGGFIWVNTLKTNSDTTSSNTYSLCIDKSNHIYASGEYYGDVDFDPDSVNQYLSPSDNNSAFVMKLSPDGQFKWMGSYKSAKNSSNAGYLDCDVDSAGNIYTAGIYRGEIDFDPDTDSFFLGSSFGQFTVLARLGKCDITDSIEIGKNNDELIAYVTSFPVKVQWLDCNNNNEPILWANSTIFKPASSGSYSVKIKYGGCYYFSKCVQFNMLGINTAFISDLKISPNPSNGIFNISYANNIDNIKVYTSTGALIYSTDKNLREIDLSNMSAGLYIVMLSGSSGVFSQKILKE